jgi:cellulose synthase operon protein C
MARLSDQLGDWLSRVELLARGAEGRRLEAVRALEEGHPAEARAEALAILDELPRSRVGLALWAEAAEAMLLDEEAEQALSLLAELIPFRADVWLRLAGARWRLARDPKLALEKANDAGDPVGAADSARLWLADRDLAAADPERALRWLEQLSLGGRSSREALLRRVEAALDLGDRARAERLAKELAEPAPADGRGALLLGRLVAGSDPARAARLLDRALLLEAPGAGRVVADLLAHTPSAELRERMARSIADLGYAGQPGWKAAFALAEGRIGEALAAVSEAARGAPEPENLERWIALAIEARQASELGLALAAAGDRLPIGPPVAALGRALRGGSDRERLAELDHANEGAVADWAGELRRATYAAWAGERTRFDEVLRELGWLGRGLGALEALPAAEQIAKDLERPLLVAVVGEFNAGKSSFINALVGEPVAPMGVLPTTATENRLVWAPDPFVRIEITGADDRLVPHADLGRALAELDLTEVARVTIYAPLEPLRRLEIIDTPGFNAPDSSHADRARQALDAAHAAVWLLDATQPLKESERAVLADLEALGLPLLVLLNKRDRLEQSAGDRAGQAVDEALAYVEQSLGQAGIAPLAPPIAFSARQALEGRRGDPDMIRRAHWPEVELLLERVLVEQSDALRDRTLRRRAASVALRLAAEQSLELRAAADRQEQRAQELRELASRLRSERARVVRELSERLEPSLEELGRDLRRLTPGAERAARRFVASRVRASVAPKLVELAIARATGAGEAASALEARVRPRIEAVCAAIGPWLVLESDPSAARWTLAESSVDELLRAAAELLAEPALPRQNPLELRARALADALAGGDARRSSAKLGAS